MNSIKKNILVGTFWSVMGRFANMAIALLVNILLTRMLTPHEFGQLGVIMFFIAAAQVLTESGLSGALVRKKKASSKDFSTVFFFNLGISISIFTIIFLSSNYIANYYKDPLLADLLKVSSTILIINAFQIVQRTKLVIAFKFRTMAFYNLIAIILSSIVGLSMAYFGEGVWSLVYMQIALSFFYTLMLWIFEKPLSKFTFSISSFKELFRFGFYTTISSMLNSAFDYTYQLIFAKYFSISPVGVFYQAKKLQEVPVNVIQSTALGVIFSALSKLQGNKKNLIMTYNQVMFYLTIFTGILIASLYLYSDTIILVLYGNKWAASSYFMKILSLASFFYIQEIFIRIIFKVYNQTHKILFLELIKKAVHASSIIVGIYFMSLDILLYGFLITNIISYVTNLLVSRKLLETTNWPEIMLLLRVVVSVLILFGFNYLIHELFKLTEYTIVLIFPVFLFLYFSSLNILGIKGIFKDTKKILTLFKN